MAVADALAGRYQVRDFLAPDQMPEAVAHDPTPDVVELLLRRGAESLYRVDACRVHARLHALADPVEVAELEGVQDVREVTESGGPLSHGAVTAREMGIPAAMSVKHCLSRLQNGQRVRVDGAAGRVELLDV